MQLINLGDTGPASAATSFLAVGLWDPSATFRTIAEATHPRVPEYEGCIVIY